jgi:hypothetical protein
MQPDSWTGFAPLQKIAGRDILGKAAAFFAKGKK